MTARSLAFIGFSRPPIASLRFAAALAVFAAACLSRDGAFAVEREADATSAAAVAENLFSAGALEDSVASPGVAAGAVHSGNDSANTTAAAGAAVPATAGALADALTRNVNEATGDVLTSAPLDLAETDTSFLYLFHNLPPIVRAPKVKLDAASASPDLQFLEVARRLSSLTGYASDATTGSRAHFLRSRRPAYLRGLTAGGLEQTSQTALSRESAGEKRGQEGKEAKAKELGWDVNTATVEELSSIPGLPDLNERRARAIVEYRTIYGPFHYLDELSHVFGVTDAQVDAWRKVLYVAPPEAKTHGPASYSEHVSVPAAGASRQ